MCTFALLLAPCLPLLPRGPAPAVCPSLVSCQPLFFCFFWCPLVALFAAHARPACAPCSSPCYPCLAAPCPLPGLSPLPSAVSLGVLPVISDRPHCLCRAVTRVCHPRALPLRPSVIPTLFPGGSPTFVFFLWSLSLSSSGMPWFTVWGGRVYLRTGLWPCSWTG